VREPKRETQRVLQPTGGAHRATSRAPALRRVLPLGSLLGASLWVACAGRLEDPERFRECVIDVEVDVFRQTCGTSGCHMAGPNAAAGLDLSSPGVASRLVNKPSTCNGKLFISGPDEGYLLEKVTQDTPACGTRMPATGSLTDEELRCLRRWTASTFDGGTP
jgi:hypothetical protein